MDKVSSQKNNNLPSVSIVIVTYNSEKYIKNCLKAIERSRNNINIEIIIVDNASQDLTANIIQRKFPNVLLIQNISNIGFSKANNLALRISRGKYVFLLNPDTEISNQGIGELYSFMEKKENQNVWCAGGILLDENNQPQFSFGRFPKLTDVFFEQFGLHKIFTNYYQKNVLQTDFEIPQKNIIVDFISGANMFIRKKTLDKVGYFDEDFFLNYEETELALRASKKSQICQILYRTRIIHYGQKSFNSRNELIRQLKVGQLLYFKKSNYTSYIIAKIVLILGTILRIISLKKEKKLLLNNLLKT